ncbi:type IV pre-pilin [Legionella gratiana]|uniref:Type IV pre-pilin n=2 Tax=Legionella gratiana TaxID=45066 RepID=A0A378JG09_9GAMM|nr:type IV pre-pilin [Legionella gratiana]STX45797.1 type IV pre-pilin [Legionella gratiana]
MNNRLVARTDMFVNALNYARNTALGESINVVVCPFGIAQSTTCGGNWSNGWIVITQPSVGASTLLQSQQLLPSDPVLSSNVVSIVFDRHGLTTTPGNFKFCDSRGGTFARSVEVLATGFVQSSVTPGQAVWDNSALTCP